MRARLLGLGDVSKGSNYVHVCQHDCYEVLLSLLLGTPGNLEVDASALQTRRHAHSSRERAFFHHQTVAYAGFKGSNWGDLSDGYWDAGALFRTSHSHSKDFDHNSLHDLVITTT